MKCPTCDSSNLVIIERAGVEIDYCPSCSQVWLAREQLESLLEQRSNKPLHLFSLPSFGLSGKSYSTYIQPRSKIT